MKNKFLIIIILFWTGCSMMNYAGPKFIPEGSQSLGVYEGSFNGVRYGGDILIHLYRTPKGDKLFRGTLIIEPFEPDVGRGLFVRGKMTSNSLQGEFQDVSGTINGKLSSDGKQLTGFFNLADLNKGTWQARKK